MVRRRWECNRLRGSRRWCRPYPLGGRPTVPLHEGVVQFQLSRPPRSKEITLAYLNINCSFPGSVRCFSKHAYEPKMDGGGDDDVLLILVALLLAGGLLLYSLSQTPKPAHTSRGGGGGGGGIGLVSAPTALTPVPAERNPAIEPLPANVDPRSTEAAIITNPGLWFTTMSNVQTSRYTNDINWVWAGDTSTGIATSLVSVRDSTLTCSYDKCGICRPFPSGYIENQCTKCLDASGICFAHTQGCTGRGWAATGRESGDAPILKGWSGWCICGQGIYVDCQTPGSTETRKLPDGRVWTCKNACDYYAPQENSVDITYTPKTAPPPPRS